MICYKAKPIKHYLLCSTMGVGCQSRRFNCLFWRETRQRILGHEISPYPEVVRGPENESWRRDPERGKDHTVEELVAGEREARTTQLRSWWLERERQGRQSGQLVTGEQRGRQQKLAWKNGGAANTRHRAERRGGR